MRGRFLAFSFGRLDFQVSPSDSNPTFYAISFFRINLCISVFLCYLAHPILGLWQFLVRVVGFIGLVLQASLSDLLEVLW